MPEFNNGINLVLAADNNYAQHLGVALASIIANYRDQRALFIHILDNGISAENRINLSSIGARPGVELIFYSLAENLLAHCPEVNHLSRATYARLLIPEIIPAAISKIIYLDADIVVLGNIAELYDQDLGAFPLGAVADVMAKEILRIYFYPGLENYFNAGVLLINLDSWRRLDIKDRSWDFINCHFKEIIRADQDVLNCLFKNDWKLLDDRFNTDIKRRGFWAKPDPDTVVLHYSDRLKPWNYIYSGISKRYYFTYLSQTPWKDFKYTDKNLKNFFKKYCWLTLKGLKRSLLLILPSALLDSYRRLLWRTYKMKE